MRNERLVELERQVRAFMCGSLAVAARADGAEVVTEDGKPLAMAIRLLLSELRREVPYDSCSLQELRGSRLVIIAGVGFSDLDVILGEAFDIDNLDTPNGEVVHRSRPLIVSDTENYRAFRRGLHVGAGILSWLGVPILHDGRTWGILALDKTEPHFYSDVQAQQALAFASLVGLAMALSREMASSAGA